VLTATGRDDIDPGWGVGGGFLRLIGLQLDEQSFGVCEDGVSVAKLADLVRFTDVELLELGLQLLQPIGCRGGDALGRPGGHRVVQQPQCRAQPRELLLSRR
jgi:hypothetical protein